MAELIEKYLGISSSFQSKILYTLIVILFFGIIERLIRRFIIQKIDTVTVRYQWQKIIKYSSALMAILFLVRVWFGAFESLGTYFGLLSAGLAIAFKDLLVNFVGWIFIIVRKPLKVGDRVQVGEITGDVIDVRIFQFSVIEIGNWVDADQSTGRIIHIPNGIIFSTPQANYTEGFEYIWNEIPVLITFESNWRKAKTILTEAVDKFAINLSEEAERQIKEAAKRFMIFYKKLTPIVYTSVKDSGVLLTMRYLCHARTRRSTEETIWEYVLDQFALHDDIDFAYPTKRFYDNVKEGKPGTKPRG